MYYLRQRETGRKPPLRISTLVRLYKWYINLKDSLNSNLRLAFERKCILVPKQMAWDKAQFGLLELIEHEMRKKEKIVVVTDNNKGGFRILMDILQKTKDVLTALAAVPPSSCAVAVSHIPVSRLRGNNLRTLWRERLPLQYDTVILSRSIKLKSHL